MQRTGFLNWESVSVLTSSITSKKCGRKMNHLQYEGCELCTLATLSKVQQYCKRDASIQSGPSYKVKHSWVIRWPFIYLGTTQYSGLIKALAKSNLCPESLSMTPWSQIRSLITWGLQSQMCLNFPQIVLFHKSCLKRKASFKIMILQSYNSPFPNTTQHL